MNGHLQLDDLDLYAIGAFDVDERRALDEHLSGCAECRRRLEEARGRMALPAIAAPPRTPPAAARRRLLDRIAAESAARMAAPPGSPRHSNWLHLIWAAAVVVLAVAFGFQHRANRDLAMELASLRLSEQRSRQAALRAESIVELLTSPDTLRVELVAGQRKPVPEGRVFYSGRRGVLFDAANLPPAPPGRTYQLWLVPATGTPVSLGIFQPDARGNAELLAAAVAKPSSPSAFAVTVEPAGGVPQPTGPKVLVGAVR